MRPRTQSVFLVGLGIIRCASPAQTSSPIGVYDLVTVGAQQLPAIGSRILAYEGATLHSARLELKQAGELQGQIVVSFTDSGTVTDTMLLTGRWQRDRDTVRFTYQYSEARWQGGLRRFRPGRAVAGVLDGLELTLPE